MLPKKQIPSFLTDVRVWVLFFFLFRLYGITHPPLEPASIWRQTDGLMVARNFYEIDANIFYPRVDLAGDQSGIMGVEFPLLNYLIFVFSKIFGFQDWYGRPINLILSSLALLSFYRLMSRFFGEGPARFASVAFLVSIWFSYSRITLPDIFGASLCMIAVEFALKYYDKNKFTDLLIYFFLALAGSLAKISAVVVLSVLALTLFDTKIKLKSKVILSLMSVVILCVVFAWYFVWVPYLDETYGYAGHFFMGQPVSESLKIMLVNWRETLKKFYDTPLKYSGFFVFVICLWIVVKRKQRLALYTFLILFLSYLVILAKSGVGLVVNSYYPIIFVPAMALIIGCGLSAFGNQRMALVLITIVAIEGIANQIHTFGVNKTNEKLLQLESVLDSVSSRKDLIAINSSETGAPHFMYFAHRRGWNVSNNELTPDKIEYLKEHDCRYLLILKPPFDVEIDLQLEKVHDSEYFKIYKIPGKPL